MWNMWREQLMNTKTKVSLKNITKTHTAEYNNIVNIIELCEDMQVMMHRSNKAPAYCHNIIIQLYTAFELIQIVAAYTLSEFIVEKNIQLYYEEATRFIEENAGTSNMDAFQKAERLLKATKIIDFDPGEEENLRTFRALRNNIHLNKISEDINIVYNKTFQKNLSQYFDYLTNYIIPVADNLDYYISKNSSERKANNDRHLKYNY
jgi:hypothetical protein